MLAAIPGPGDYALPLPDELLQAIATINQIAVFMRSLLARVAGFTRGIA
jgi:hypothetical protein